MQDRTRSFNFVSYQISGKNSVDFTYKIIFEDGQESNFTEKIIFPTDIFTSTTLSQSQINLLLFNLHLILGISYYKTYCPQKIIVSSGDLSSDQAKFWNTLYTKGLGEFFYRNQINYEGLINFPSVIEKNNPSTTLTLQTRSLVGIGGGKDSLVAIELLKKSDQKITGLVINIGPLHTATNDVISAIGIDTLVVTRQIDKNLSRINIEGKGYNGHIPISAINAFIGITTAVLYDYQYFIVANEKSANFGNVQYLGQEINHQWSKSDEFEKMFRNYLKNFFGSGVNYFSLLRPMNEIKIVEIFSRMRQFFPIFSSCNRHYKINSSNQKWCGSCAKCCFVFLILSAFVEKKAVINIFNKNLFEDDRLLDLYQDLIGAGAVKPFDCVGTPDEVRAAFYLVFKRNEFNESVIMQWFIRSELKNIQDPEKLVSELMTIDSFDSIPIRFKNIYQSL